MSNTLQSVLEKFKKVDGGILDPQRSGADGAEDNFIGKHIDNVQPTDGPGVEKEKGHPHNAGEKAKMADRKKDRKGYSPKEDAEVYESADEGYDIEDFYVVDEEEEIDVDMEVIKEDAMYFLNIFEEAVAEFIEEEADEEEKEMLEEMMSTDEGLEELMDLLFEKKKDDDCDDDDEDEDPDDEIVIDKPKLQKTDKETKAKVTEGYVSHAQRKAVWASRADEKKKKKMKENADVVTKHGDFKMVRTRTPEGKVIFRKQKKDIKVE